MKQESQEFLLSLLEEQKEKDLLLKDLCSRLPYGVKIYVKNWSKLESRWIEGIYTVKSIHPSVDSIFVSSDIGSVEVIMGHNDYKIEPYLYPLSSMTEEQKKELQSFMTQDSYGILYHTIESYDYLNKHHFDYRGLIQKGLALDATGLDIY